VDSDEDIKSKTKPGESGNEILEGYEEGDFVFGSNSYKASMKKQEASGGSANADTSDGFIYYDDESDEDQLETLDAAFTASSGSVTGGAERGKGGMSSSASIASSNPNREPKRDHKRLKHWGKKNKKNQDKDPYSEFNGVVSYVAYTTNRAKVGGEQWQQVKLQGSTSMQGSLYTRQKLPYNDPVLASTLDPTSNNPSNASKGAGK
jgi:hypothetical protein